MFIESLLPAGRGPGGYGVYKEGSAPLAARTENEKHEKA